MPPPKPRNACYKDSIVAFLALKAHFSIADDHPTDTNLTELAKLMLQHDPRANSWKGQYYDACKLYIQENLEEVQRNSLDVDKLLHATPSVY